MRIGEKEIDGFAMLGEFVFFDGHGFVFLFVEYRLQIVLGAISDWLFCSAVIT